MDTIPTEIQHKILGSLGLADAMTCRLVNRKWNSLICSDYLPNLHPTLTFSREKSLHQFLELMGKSMQQFPFSKFGYCFSSLCPLDLDGVCRVCKDVNCKDVDCVQFSYKDVVTFANKYGRFVKRYAFGISAEFYGEFYKSNQNSLAVRTRLNKFKILLNHSPKLASLKVDLDSIVELPQVFHKLTKLKFGKGSSAIGSALLESLLSKCPNLQQISLPLPESLEASSFKLIQHIPVVHLNHVCISTFPNPKLDDLLGLPLRVQKLCLSVLVTESTRNHEVFLQSLNAWISSLSDTLEHLQIKVYARPVYSHRFIYGNGIQPPEIQIPYLKKLKHLTLESDLPNNRSCFSALISEDLPCLIDLKLLLHPGNVLAAESFFSGITHLKFCYSGPDDTAIDWNQWFPNVEEIELGQHAVEMLPSVLTRLRDLKRLRVEVKGQIPFLQVWPILSGNVQLPTDNSFLNDMELPALDHLLQLPKLTFLLFKICKSNEDIDAEDRLQYLLRVITYLSLSKCILPLCLEIRVLGLTVVTEEMQQLLASLRRYHRKVDFFANVGQEVHYTYAL